MVIEYHSSKLIWILLHSFVPLETYNGYFDLDGHLLFEIKIEDDKINESSIRAFKNGKVYLESNKYQYVFNKDGSYERTCIVQRYWGKTYHYYDAERWDALTDGMEGDYPGSGVDYDLLGF